MAWSLGGTSTSKTTDPYISALNTATATELANYYKSNPLDTAYNEYMSLNTASAAAGAAPKVYAPMLDTNSIWEKAKASASKLYDMGNPSSFYAQELKRYTDEIGRQQQEAQGAADMQNKFADAYMTDFLGRQRVEEQRTRQDVATGMQSANQGYQSYEKSSSRQKEYGLADLRSDIAAGNLTTSGIGRQKLGQFIESNNIQDQNTKIQYDAERQKLNDFATRTFQDILADRRTKQREHAEGEEELKINLKNTMGELAYKLVEEKWDLEKQNQEAALRETQLQAKNNFNQWIATITDPAQREAAMQTYGSAF